MSEDQKLLMRYLVDIKTPMHCALLIVNMMWEENTIMKLFGYIVEHPEADYNELYEIAYKIASEAGTLNDYSMMEDPAPDEIYFS